MLLLSSFSSCLFSCLSSSLFFFISLLFSRLYPSLLLSFLVSPLSSSSFFSFLVLSCLLFSCLVSSSLVSSLSFSISLSLSLFLYLHHLSLSLSFSVFFLCLSLFLSVSVSVSLCLCLRVVWCCVVLCCVVWCGVVCGAAWHAEKTSVCRFKTSACVPAPRAHVLPHEGDRFKSVSRNRSWSALCEFLTECLSMNKNSNVKREARRPVCKVGIWNLDGLARRRRDAFCTKATRMA